MISRALYLGRNSQDNNSSVIYVNVFLLGFTDGDFRSMHWIKNKRRRKKDLDTIFTSIFLTLGNLKSSVELFSPYRNTGISEGNMSTP